MDIDFQRPRKIAKSLSKHLNIDVAKKANEIRAKEAEFPPDIRKTIQTLKATSSPQDFVDAIEDSLLGMIEDSITSQKEELPCTDQELEVAIRCFPNALWYPLEPIYNAGESRNSKLFQLDNLLCFVPFIPVFAKLGMESGWYSERERGGLLTYQLVFGAQFGRRLYGPQFGRRLNLLEYLCLWFLPLADHCQLEYVRQVGKRTDRICARAIEGLIHYGAFGRQDIMNYQFHVKAVRMRWIGVYEHRLMQLNQLFPELNLVADPNRKDKKEFGSILSDENEKRTYMQVEDV